MIGHALLTPESQTESESVVFLVCQNCFKVHLAVQGENVMDGDITELVLELDSDILLE